MKALTKGVIFMSLFPRLFALVVLASHFILQLGWNPLQVAPICWRHRDSWVLGSCPSNRELLHLLHHIYALSRIQTDPYYILLYMMMMSFLCMHCIFVYNRVYSKDKERLSTWT